MEFLLNHAYSYFYGLAAFVVFAVILMKFGFKPIVEAIDRRDAKIKQQLDEAEATEAKARELRADLEKQLAGAEARIAELIAEGKREAEKHKGKIVADGQAEVDGMRHKALREIEAARHQAIVALRNEVADIATEVAEKILAAELDAGKHRQLVASAIEAYEAEA